MRPVIGYWICPSTYLFLFKQQVQSKNRIVLGPSVVFMGCTCLYQVYGFLANFPCTRRQINPTEWERRVAVVSIPCFCTACPHRYCLRMPESPEKEDKPFPLVNRGLVGGECVGERLRSSCKTLDQQSFNHRDGKRWVCSSQQREDKIFL